MKTTFAKQIFFICSLTLFAPAVFCDHDDKKQEKNCEFCDVFQGKENAAEIKKRWKKHQRKASRKSKKSKSVLPTLSELNGAEPCDDCRKWDEALTNLKKLLFDVDKDTLINKKIPFDVIINIVPNVS